MRLHLLSLPHTQTTSKFLTCAYTQKVVKFCKMMTKRGHEVILYAGEENEAECTELVTCITEEERRGWFGDGFDTVLTPFRWDAREPYWQLFNERAAQALRERVDWRSDILLLTTGWPHLPLTEALGIRERQRPMIACEWSVGYEGIYTEFCAFESSAWMHHVYGIRAGTLGAAPDNLWRNGRFYDAVIPNFFDLEDFAPTRRKQDYLLFVGRMVGRKGVEIAAQIAARCGRPLLLAGPGAEQKQNGEVVAPEFTITGDIEYVGEVGPVERAELMAQAGAVLVPTLYIEPFGGVAVEAMLSGTPVVTTDWGAFRETVAEGVSGRRFRTLQQGADAVEEVLKYDPRDVRSWAERYSLNRVAPQFDRWFSQLMGLWEEGWGA